MRRYRPQPNQVNHQQLRVITVIEIVDLMRGNCSSNCSGTKADESFSISFVVSTINYLLLTVVQYSSLSYSNEMHSNDGDDYQDFIAMQTSTIKRARKKFLCFCLRLTNAAYLLPLKLQCSSTAPYSCLWSLSTFVDKW